LNRQRQRTGNTRPSFRHRLAPQRKLLSALTAAALLSMAAIPPAQAAPPVTLQFAPLGGQASPSVLSFHIPLADGEHVSDIRFQAGGSETSLMTAFELTPASGGVSARFLPALDFSPYAGQSFTLKVLKAGGAAGAGEEQLLLKIIPPGDLQRELKLAAVGDGTAQADVLEFTLPGAVNVTLDDLLLVSSARSASIRNAFTLNRNRDGNIQTSLRGLDMDTLAGQSFEMRAVKTLDGSAAPLMQKLTLTPHSAGEFTRDVTHPVAVSGDAQPDPFTLALAAEANVEVTDITLGAASVLGLFNLTRASNGALSAQLATPLDFDPLIGQSIALGVRKSVAGASYQQRIILAVALPAPRLLSVDDGNIAVNGGPAASSTLRNPQYVLYSDTAGTVEVARSASGRFTNLVAATVHYAAIVAEALDPASSAWATRKSPLLTVSTQQANPDAFAFSPASGVSRSAEVTANSITVSGIRGRARISVAGGQYSMDNGVWTSAAGTVSNGQSVRVRATASGSYSTSSTVTLTIGARSGNFVVTTMAEPVVDYTPPPPTDNSASWNGETTCTVDLNALNGTQIDLSASSGNVTCTLPTITDADGTNAVTASIDGTPYVVTNGTISIDPSVLGIGSFTLTVIGSGVQKAGSTANNSSLVNKTYTIDVTATAIGGLPANNAKTKNNVTITFAAGTATLNGAPYASGTEISAEGSYTFTHSEGTTRDFEIDKTAPAIDVLGAKLSATLNGNIYERQLVTDVPVGGTIDDTFTISGATSVTPSANIEVSLDGTAWQSTAITLDGTATVIHTRFTVPGSGTYNETVTASDAATNGRVVYFDAQIDLPPGPLLFEDDDLNTITGINNTMEYAISTDGGPYSGYTAYDPLSPPDLSGNKMVKVRVINPRSQDTLLSFTAP
jgi:hypothetical protein